MLGENITFAASCRLLLSFPVWLKHFNLHYLNFYILQFGIKIYFTLYFFLNLHTHTYIIQVSYYIYMSKSNQENVFQINASLWILLSHFIYYCVDDDFLLIFPRFGLLLERKFSLPLASDLDLSSTWGATTSFITTFTGKKYTTGLCS